MAKTRCGIFIGAEDVRVVELKRTRKGLKAVGCAVHELSGEEHERPGAALKALLKKAKISADRAALCLPGDKTSTHLATLPSTDPEELKGMVRFEAERHIPFNAERHGVGYKVLRDKGVEGSEVLMAMVDGPIIERALGAAEEARVRSEGVNINAACLFNALALHHDEKATGRTIAILSIGLEAMDLVFAHEGRVLFTRSVPHGLRGLIQKWTAQGMGSAEMNRARLGSAARMIDMTAPDRGEGGAASGGQDSRPADCARAWVQRLIQELRRSYEFARRQIGCPNVEALYLTGEGAALRNLDRCLFVNLNVEVETFNPAAALDGKTVEALPFGGLEMTGAVGAAIQNELETGYAIDLAPKAYYRRMERRSLTRRAVVSGALFLMTASLAGAAWMERQDRRQRLAEQYAEINRELTPIVEKYREDEKKLDILQFYIDDPAGALAVIDQLAAYPGIGDRVTLASISYTQGDNVVLEGHAKGLNDITDFKEYLRREGIYEEVSIRDQRLKRVLRARPEVYVFRITCIIPKYEAKRGR